ncbi:MAG: hypothetical protein SWY16_15210 [Cyanobacteriota bacterium]|nr:hypothetical protein [Cyanobacteriota bacterium]
MILGLVGNTLTIEWEWFEQLWAFNFEPTMEIPFDRIESASTQEPPSDWLELRAPGTCVPGLIKAGTYYTRRGKEFWYVTQQQNYLVLKLRDFDYKTIVLTLDNAESWSERINLTVNQNASDALRL